MQAIGSVRAKHVWRGLSAIMVLVMLYLVSNMVSNYSTLQVAVQHSKTSLKAAQDEASRLTQEVDQTTAQLLTSRTKTDELQASIAKLEAEAVRSKEEISELKETLARESRAVEKKREEFAALQRTVARVQETAKEDIRAAVEEEQEYGAKCRAQLREAQDVLAQTQEELVQSRKLANALVTVQESRDPSEKSRKSTVRFDRSEQSVVRLSEQSGRRGPRHRTDEEASDLGDLEEEEERLGAPLSDLAAAAATDDDDDAAGAGAPRPGLRPSLAQVRSGTPSHGRRPPANFGNRGNSVRSADGWDRRQPEAEDSAFSERAEDEGVGEYHGQPPLRRDLPEGSDFSEHAEEEHFAPLHRDDPVRGRDRAGPSLGEDGLAVGLASGLAESESVESVNFNRHTEESDTPFYEVDSGPAAAARYGEEEQDEPMLPLEGDNPMAKLLTSELLLEDRAHDWAENQSGDGPGGGRRRPPAAGRSAPVSSTRRGDRRRRDHRRSRGGGRNNDDGDVVDEARERLESLESLIDQSNTGGDGADRRAPRRQSPLPKTGRRPPRRVQAGVVEEEQPVAAGSGFGYNAAHSEEDGEEEFELVEVEVDEE